MKEKIKEAIKPLDLFGCSFAPKVNGMDSISTTASSVISLILMGFSAFLLYNEIQTFFTRRKYDVSMAFGSIPESSVQTVPAENLKVMVSIFNIDNDDMSRTEMAKTGLVSSSAVASSVSVAEYVASFSTEEETEETTTQETTTEEEAEETAQASTGRTARLLEEIPEAFPPGFVDCDSTEETQAMSAEISAQFPNLSFSPSSSICYAATEDAKLGGSPVLGKDGKSRFFLNTTFNFCNIDSYYCKKNNNNNKKRLLNEENTQETNQNDQNNTNSNDYDQKSDDSSDDESKSTFMVIIVQDSVGSYKQDKGYQNTYKVYTHFLNENKSKLNATMTLQKTLLHSDSSLIFSELSTEDTSFFSHSESYLDQKGNSSDEITFSIEFLVSLNTIEVERVYQTVDEQLASFWVIVQVAIIVATFFNGLFNDNAVEMYLIRRLYCQDADADLTSLKNPSFRKRSKTVFDYNKVENIIESNWDKQSGSSVRKSIVAARDRTVRVRKIATGANMSLRRLLGLKSEARKVVRKCIDYLEFDTDYLTLVRRGIQLEALMKVLLSKTQTDLMCLINSRPVSGKHSHDAIIADAKESLPNYENLPDILKRVNSQAEDINEHDYLTSRILEILDQD